MGAPAKSVRIALGALIIKERLCTSDEETVQQIQENQYLQYFLGFEEYQDEQLFDPSIFVHFHKRLGKKTMSKINEVISLKALEDKQPKGKQQDKDRSDHNDDPDPPQSFQNKGKLIIDATCAPAEIGFDRENYSGI